MEIRTVSTSKEGHRFLFRYEVGHEDEVLDTIARLAEQDSCSLDWVDAATLCFQVTRQSAVGCCNALVPWHEV
jgi:hypothetical protein